MSDPRDLYSEALDFFGQSRLAEAKEIMEELIRDHPKFLDAYEGLAMVYSRMENQDEAIKVMEQLAKIDPDNSMVHSNLSLFYMRKGMKEKAEEEQAKATALKFSKKKPKS